MSRADVFIWNELDTADQEKSGSFFCKLLGWTLKKVDAGEFGVYTIFQKQGHDLAGMMNPTPLSPSGESRWQTYIAVDDVDECAAQTIKLGGKVIVPPHEVVDFGRVCLIADPTGATVPLVTPIQKG